jgi:hypothetical protein
MNSSLLVLAVIVFAQVLAFLFVSIQLGRAMPDAMVGQAGLPDEVANQVAKFRREMGRGRSILGAVLCLATAVTALVLPLEHRLRTLGLAAVSLLSSGALVVGYARDYRKVLALSRQLSEPPVRVASLSPRSLRTFYSPFWEALVAAIYAAMIVFTVWFTLRPSSVAVGAPAVGSGSLTLANPRLWIQPIIGAVLLPGLFALSFYNALFRGSLTSRSKAFHTSPDAAMDHDQRLRMLEMRFILVCRIGIALLLLVIQARTILSLRAGEVPGWTGLVLMLLTIVLLVALVRYSVQMNRAMRSAPCPPVSAACQK